MQFCGIRAAVRYGRPAPNYAEAPPHQQAPFHGDLRMVRMTPGPGSRARCGGRLEKINDYGARANPIPVCSQINNYARDELWTSRALPVDGLGVRLRGFRKSHQLIPAGAGPSGACIRQRRDVSACRACRVRITLVSDFSKGKVETACPSSKALSIPGTIRSLWSRISPPTTTGRSNAPAKTR